MVTDQPTIQQIHIVTMITGSSKMFSIVTIIRILKDTNHSKLLPSKQVTNT